MLTFIIKEPEVRELIEKRIQEKRYHGKYDFLVAFFTPCKKNTLSYGHKISTFPLQTETSGEIDFFINTVNQADILNAKLSVECGNGSITSMVDHNWRTSSFSQIERVYRGPSMRYNKDVLFFYNRNHQDSREDLTLTLEF